jgi:hypothetical protein
VVTTSNFYIYIRWNSCHEDGEEGSIS